MNFSNYFTRTIVINKVVLAIIGLFIINFHDYKAITILLYLPFILIFFNYSIIDARTYIESVRFNIDEIEINYSVFFKKYIVKENIGNCSMKIFRDKRMFFERYLLKIEINNIEIKQYEVLTWNKKNMDKLVEEFNEKIAFDND